MTEAEKRDKILAKLKVLWESYPNLRLCQLMGNMFNNKDLYNITDNELNQQLTHHIKKGWN